MAAAIDAIVTHQPGSRALRMMTAVAYYAGLPPSEVVMLRIRSATLPAEAWGRLEVTEADISFDEPGEPKTGPRSVPIAPVIVTMLAEWIDQNNLTDSDGRLFRTRNDTRPSGSNWIRWGGSPASTVSQHLAKLRLAKLVRTRWHGTQVFYVAENDHLERLTTEALFHADQSSITFVVGELAEAAVGPADRTYCDCELWCW